MGIERVRIEAMFNAMGSGVKRTDDIIRQADHAETAVKLSRGKSSVYNFFDVSPKFGIVEKVFLSTQNEDMNFGTDAWMVLKPNHPFRILPVQIKSSDKGVCEFKNSSVYQRINELVIVLNTRKGRKHNLIVREFLGEYDRVVSKMFYLKDKRDSALDFILSKNNT